MTTTDNTEPRGPFTPTSLMHLLWAQAKHQLDDDTLEWIRDNAVSTVSTQACNLAATVEGIGCLVASDKDVGSFGQPDTLADLLFGLPHQIENLAALSGLATEVAHLQDHRQVGWAKAPEPARPPASH